MAGVNIDDPKEKEKIYQKYLKAFKKGVFNYIKEEVDPTTQETIPRKYFSGGFALGIGPKLESADATRAMIAVSKADPNRINLISASVAGIKGFVRNQAVTFIKKHSPYAAKLLAYGIFFGRDNPSFGLALSGTILGLDLIRGQISKKINISPSRLFDRRTSFRTKALVTVTILVAASIGGCILLATGGFTINAAYFVGFDVGEAAAASFIERIKEGLKVESNINNTNALASQAMNTQEEREMINSLHRVKNAVYSQNEQGNYQEVVDAISPHQNLLDKIEEFDKENELRKILISLKESFISAQVHLLQQTAYALVADGDLEEGRKKYDESKVLIDKNEGLAPTGSLQKYHDGVTRINAFTETFQNLDDINTYKKFLNMRAGYYSKSTDAKITDNI
ncbi:MAG: hypothetical protein HQL13_03640, partial [Candidatus Omnitrophica bacterium]|nr:hypothetical protein [Candidatus Omnitrophota bacterium]